MNWKVPAPFPRYTLMGQSFCPKHGFTAKSRFPFPVKSATIACCTTAALSVKLVNWSVVGAETGRNATFDTPPPGLGLETVMDAVLAVAMFEDGTLAVNSELVTKVVVNGVPFQLIVDPLTNPVPFTVSVKPDPPGATADGTSG